MPTESGNAYQQKSSEKKLRGEVFTPLWLASAVVAGEGLSGVVVDPACGDGVFLEAVLRARVAAGDANACAGLFGFDVDETNARLAQERVNRTCAELGIVAVSCVERANFLEPVPALLMRLPPLLGRLVAREAEFSGGVDRFVGNPPYVDAKRLDSGEKAALRLAYPSATNGAGDLYLYFVHRCLELLSEGGSLSFLLPNKLLIANYAEPLRARLLAGRSLREVVFLSHLPVFAKTSVYPIILRAGNQPLATVRLSRPAWTAEGLGQGDEAASGVATAAGTEAVATPEQAPGNVLDLPHHTFETTQSRCIFAPPANPIGRALLARIGLSSRVRSVVDIRWTISFHATGLRSHYIFPTRPDSAFAMPFVGGASFSGNTEVQRYRSSWAGTWIDYDEDRARRDKNSLPPRSLFEGERIVVCQNARRLRAAFTDQGYAYKDTFLLGIPQIAGGILGRYPRALVALLNSDLAHFFYATVFYGGHVSGGYLHYLAPYVGEIPLGEWSESAAQRATALVHELEQTDDGTVLDAELQSVVAEAFALTPEEQAFVRDFAAELRPSPLVPPAEHPPPPKRRGRPPRQSTA